MGIDADAPTRNRGDIQTAIDVLRQRRAAVVGTRSAKSLSERRGALNIVFAIVIIVVAIYMLMRNLSLSWA